MAKRLETIFKRLQKDGKKIQENRDKSAKRPGKMQRDGKKIWNDIKKMVKRPEKTAKRPGKWQRYGRKTHNNRENIGRKYGKKTQNDTEMTAKSPRKIAKDGKRPGKMAMRWQKDPERY